MSKLLSVQSLEKYYSSKVPVLKGIDFSIEKGEILALVGASGCGKSTLLRCIAGFEKPQKGCILMNEKVLFDGKTHVLPESRSVGFLFQDYALFPHLSVKDNIRFGLHKIDEHTQRIQLEYYLEAMDIEELRSRYPHEISGGQQQRVALARALAPEPSLMLLDEPFSNIDAQLKHTMRLAIRKLFKQLSTTAIVVTHDIEDAIEMADKIAVMHQGEIIQLGTPEELMKSPVSTTVASFFGTVNRLKVTETLKAALDLPATSKREVGILPEDFEIRSAEKVNAQLISKRQKGFVHIYIVEIDEQLIEIQSIKEVENIQPQQPCFVSLSSSVRILPAH